MANAMGHPDPLIPTLKAARDKAGLSDHALATRAGIPYTTYRRNMLVGAFTMPQLRAMARVLDTPLAHLFALADGGEAA